MSKDRVVLQANPLAQYLSNESGIRAAIDRVLDSGWYVLGEEVRSFEIEWAKYIGVSYACGVASGTDALQMSLRACGIGPGDEVITAAHTAVATVAAIELAGATPVLVDIEPKTWLMDVSKVERSISKRTRAVIAVHLYGQPADLERLGEITRRHGLRLIEDCAQSHGAMFKGRRTGVWGDLACFSFYPTKNLGAIGDGGMVVTNDAELAERMRGIREYGWKARYLSSEPGMNSRLDEIQAAILRAKLGGLDQSNGKRVEIAGRYTEALSKYLTVPVIKADRSSVFHLYVIYTADRDSLKVFLEQNGVQSAVHYPAPIHLQPAYRGRLGDTGSFPVAEDACQHLLSLPMYPELANESVSRVISCVRAFFK